MRALTPNSGIVSPVRTPLLLCAFRRKHRKCLLFSILMYACLGGCIVCSILSQCDESEDEQNCALVYYFVLISAFLIFYVIYVIECWGNAPILYPLVTRQDALQHISLLKHAAPIIWWRAVCYHFERRSRQIVRYRNAALTTTTQTYHERTNSHVDEQEFDYSDCGVRDVSSEMENIEKYPLVVIEFGRCFSFSHLESENQYLGQRCDFFRANETWDSYLEAKEGMKLRNVAWQDKLIVCEDVENPPLYANLYCYWVASLLLFSWLFRVFIDHKTATLYFQVEKLFGYVNESDTEGNAWESIPRVATMDSTELEWLIQTDQMHIPSYSEATRGMATNPSSIEDHHPTPDTANLTSMGDKHASTSAHMRSRGTARDGPGQTIATSVRRSMSLLFRRGTSETQDDVNLLSSIPSLCTSKQGRPLSDSPPTYSEVMNLHKALDQLKLDDIGCTRDDRDRYEGDSSLTRGGYGKRLSSTSTYNTQDQVQSVPGCSQSRSNQSQLRVDARYDMYPACSSQVPTFIHGAAEPAAIQGDGYPISVEVDNTKSTSIQHDVAPKYTSPTACETSNNLELCRTLSRRSR